MIGVRKAARKRSVVSGRRPNNVDEASQRVWSDERIFRLREKATICMDGNHAGSCWEPLHLYKKKGLPIIIIIIIFVVVIIIILCKRESFVVPCKVP